MGVVLMLKKNCWSWSVLKRWEMNYGRLGNFREEALNFRTVCSMWYLMVL